MSPSAGAPKAGQKGAKEGGRGLWASGGPENGAWDVGKAGGRCDQGRGTILYRNCVTCAGPRGTREDKAQLNIEVPGTEPQHGGKNERGSRDWPGLSRAYTDGDGPAGTSRKVMAEKDREEGGRE